METKGEPKTDSWCNPTFRNLPEEKESVKKTMKEQPIRRKPKTYSFTEAKKENVSEMEEYSRNSPFSRNTYLINKNNSYFYVSKFNISFIKGTQFEPMAEL